MWRIHPSILFLMAVFYPSPSLAETVGYTQLPSTVAYKVASNSWTVTIRHPFRVLQFSGRNVRGDLWFTPGFLNKGLKYHLEFSFEPIPWPDADLKKRVLHCCLGNVTAVDGSTVDLIRTSERDEDEAILETHPNVQVQGRSMYPAVRIRSVLDGKVLRWAFSSEFPLTDLGMQVPSLWGIPGENKVTVSGEVSFSPKD